MQLTVNKKVFQTALANTLAIVPARCPRPILQCVLLKVDKRSIEITGSDGDVVIRQRIREVAADVAGEVCVPAAKLAEIVGAQPDDVITICCQNKDAVVISGEDSSFKVHTYPVDEYPPAKTHTTAPDISLAASDVTDALTKTQFAAAKEVGRYAINGVLLEQKAKTLRFVATDGHRMAMATLKTEAAAEFRVTLPIRVSSVLRRLLVDPEHRVDIAVSKGHIFVDITDGKHSLASIVTPLMEGEFPPYQSVIPPAGDRKARIDVARFTSMVRRAAIMTTAESNSVKLEFNAKGLQVHGQAPDVGMADLFGQAEFDGQEIVIAFNPDYLLDGLKHCGAESVSVEMSGANKPSVIRAGDFLYVVMPVNKQ